MKFRTTSTALALLAFAGCNKTVGDTLRPDDHTAAAATGAEPVCSGTPSRIKPLVVDWNPDDRVDLEAAMQGSVVVVKYDCPTMEILPGCTVEGSYSYAGVSRKEQVVQMTNMDEVNANIPVSSGSVGGEIQSGRAIDLATVLVGRQSTTLAFLERDRLTGQCDGATHFVRSASLGAFAMSTGSVGKAAVVAEMFGVGGGASSNSERSALNKDGNLDSCRNSTPDDENPPPECRAPVRIELIPLADHAEKGESKAALEAEKQAAAENPCLPGYVFSDGICTLPSEATALICEPKDEAACKAECDKGSAGSCLNYGRILVNTKRKDQAMVPFKKACEGDFTEACTALGETVYMDADPEFAQYQAMMDQAFELVTQGCDGGDGYGCELRGDMFDTEDYNKYDRAKAFRAYTRSCDLGSSFGCYAAAMQQLKGRGIPVDVSGGLKTLARSCEGGNSDECHTLAMIYDKGEYGAPTEPTKALKLYSLSCAMDWAYCEDAGIAAEKLGDLELAVKFFKRDCREMEEGGSEACGRLGKMYVDGRGVDKDEAKGKEMLEKACKNGYDQFSCDTLGIPVPE